MDESTIYVDQLRRLVMEGHLRGALELLNIQSGYRFTAIYRLGATHAENFMLVDRDREPATPFTADIPLDETYCHKVESLAALVIEDASSDARLTTHKYRDIVRAYCSVSLLEADGSKFGTLCQFDTAPRVTSEATLRLMREMGRMLRSDVISTPYRRADIDERVDRLSDMRGMISEASLDGDDALSTFDIYAGPLIAEAGQRLPPCDALEVSARISDIRNALLDGR
ncbi:hypothetical protein E5843_14455 [Luteimonas yindakuii]|uniref:hypothetical protein n=1 Tax=Luteimonas yindakuii TaxID=2565782 RepID=UPI0011075F0A|nr:hypothetical protein [Luteimonas yindakuii]QCU72527.1 hypothetical protein E5843_14455 [Luteimonas yindakuii]